MSTVLAAPSQAQTAWQASAVLDLSLNSRQLFSASREQGLSHGHSDLSVRGPLGQHLQSQLSLSAHRHDGKSEAELEEAWLQTQSLANGWQIRAGRFASQITYLNEQHPHADDFSERPLLYRTLFGGHWFDDGLRLNWTAPGSFYLTTGVEVFRGKQLMPAKRDLPAWSTASFRLRAGDDINQHQSWQAGISYLHNRASALPDQEHHHGHETDHAADHDESAHAHAHGAMLTGRHTWALDLVWKWAPDGNNRQRQVKLIAEAARVTQLNSFARHSDQHLAYSLAAVWRFRQDWETGLRADYLNARLPHDQHFHDLKLREYSLMLAWKPLHSQTLRLQLSQQNNLSLAQTQRALQLQYLINFGAHGAHSY